MTPTQQQASAAAVKAILEARKSAAVEVQSIPALPPRPTIPQPSTPSQPAVKPAPTPTITAQSITQPVAVPSVQVAPPPQVSDGEVEAFLTAHLPGLTQAAIDLATPPFQISEVIRLGTAVSAAVAQGLPQVRGTEARVLVVVTSRYLWRTHATPRLPATVRPFAPLLETLLIAGIEAGYQIVVKRRA